LLARRSPVMITDHVPAVRAPPDHATNRVAAAVPAWGRPGRPPRSWSCATSSPADGGNPEANRRRGTSAGFTCPPLVVPAPPARGAASTV